MYNFLSKARSPPIFNFYFLSLECLVTFLITTNIGYYFFNIFGQIGYSNISNNDLIVDFWLTIFR